MNHQIRLENIDKSHRVYHSLQHRSKYLKYYFGRIKLKTFQINSEYKLYIAIKSQTCRIKARTITQTSKLYLHMHNSL